MNTKLIIFLTFTFALILDVAAGSATWDLNPTSGDWNTAVNWSPPTVPDGPGDIATFSLSNQTSVSISADTEVSSVVFDPGASAFTVTMSSTELTLSGTGISNSSGVSQTFVTEGFFSSVLVHNDSTLGNATIINQGGTNYLEYGVTQIYDTATAGHSLLIANGSMYDGIYGSGVVTFFGNSKAGNATLIANGGQVSGASGGAIIMASYSTAENGTFTANGGSVSGAFGGRLIFGAYAPTAAMATLIANGGVGTAEGEGGGIVFSSGSAGAQAHVELYENGFLDLRPHDTPELTIGSLEGDGLVFTGGVNLSVGSNDLSTIFSGVIEENSEGTTGALTKIGAGMLELSGANTYTGGTTLNAGGLVINNTTGSGTGTGAVQVNGGILAGSGIISGAVTVGTGSGTGAFLTPGMGASTATTLTIQSALTFKADGTYTCRLNTKKTKADQLIANGVTIESGAQFAFKVTGNEQLHTGKSAIVISNTSANPISGTFANLPDGSTFTVGPNTFQASYSGGDGNDLILTVVP
jgi:autotransporter-associated beta strand protein